ncbi:MAG: response regulator transcription factor [Anaerolineales bacterium]
MRRANGISRQEGAEMGSIRVLIVDDVARVRQELGMVLTLAGNAARQPVEIVGEAANGQEAVQLAAALQPDVVLMDLAMPVLDGFAATRAIKTAHPSVRVVVLTVLDYPTAAEKAIRAGADGFIEKGASVAEIFQTIRNTGGS